MHLIRAAAEEAARVWNTLTPENQRALRLLAAVDPQRLQEGIDLMMPFCRRVDPQRKGA